MTQTVVLKARSALFQVQDTGEFFQFLHCFSFPLHHYEAGGENEFQKDIVLTKYKPLLLWRQSFGGCFVLFLLCLLIIIVSHFNNGQGNILRERQAWCKSQTHNSKGITFGPRTEKFRSLETHILPFSVCSEMAHFPSTSLAGEGTKSPVQDKLCYLFQQPPGNETS